MESTPIQSLRGADLESDLVKLTFLVPRWWRQELKDAAQAQAISMADVCRLLLREFLRRRTGGPEAVMEDEE